MIKVNAENKYKCSNCAEVFTGYSWANHYSNKYKVVTPTPGKSGDYLFFGYECPSCKERITGKEMVKVGR